MMEDRLLVFFKDMNAIEVAWVVFYELSLLELVNLFMARWVIYTINAFKLPLLLLLKEKDATSGKNHAFNSIYDLVASVE